MIAVGRVKGPAQPETSLDATPLHHATPGEQPSNPPETNRRPHVAPASPSPKRTATSPIRVNNPELQDVTLDSPQSATTSPVTDTHSANEPVSKPLAAQAAATASSVSDTTAKTHPDELKPSSTSGISVVRVTGSSARVPEEKPAAPVIGNGSENVPPAASHEPGYDTARAPASGKPKIAFKPRTSSLQPVQPTEQLQPPPLPKPQPIPEEPNASWTDFIRSRATLFGIGQYASSITSHSDSEVELPREPPTPTVPGSHDSLLSDLDPDSSDYLLKRLERENQALALNRKAILVEDGAIRAAQTTIQGLMSESASYSTKAPGPGQDNGDVEFWNSIIDDFATIHKIPHLLSAKVRAGIPPHLRAKIWTIMSGAQKERFESLYPLLLKQDSPFERIIQRDLPRTFPKLDMFKEEGGEGQKKLYNLLKAYSIFDAEVGYCQGLSFLVGPLLMQDMTEVEAFSVFVRLMEENAPRPSSSVTSSTPPTQSHRRYGLRTLFTTQMTGLHLLLHQHTELVRLHLPALYAHFQTHGITATMYASQWFLTLFTYNFPLPLVFRIFDIIFAEGASETMLRFSLAILKRNEPSLLREDEFEGVLDFLKGGKLYNVYEEDPEWVLKDAASVQELVTEKGLDEMAEKYKEEHQKRASAISDAELAALQALIRQLRSDASKGQQDLGKLQKENAELREELEAAKATIRELKGKEGE